MNFDDIKQDQPSSLFVWVTSSLSCAQTKSYEQLRALSVKIPALAALFTTPQTPPWHGEGLTVADHLARMMGALELIVTDPEFLKIEAWREGDLQLFMRDIQLTCVKYQDLLLAFILTHDLAKAETVVLEGAPGSVGEREGFLGKQPATKPERERYLKLARAAGGLENDVAKVAKMAFSKLGVQAHYPLHDRLGASVHYSEGRLAIMRELKLDESYARFLATLIRLHLDAVSVLTKRVEARRLQAFEAIARHAGINVELFQEILPAVTLLDGVFGILPVRDGEWAVNTALIQHYLLAEREAWPLCYERRMAGERRRLRERVQGILERHDLSPLAIFAVLKTPIGPQRGEVMREVYQALREEEYVPKLGGQTPVLLPLIKKARLAIIQEELPFL